MGADEVKEPKFFNKDGSLTQYALARGYIQTGTFGVEQLRLSFNGATYDLDVWGEDLREMRESPSGHTYMTGWVQVDSLTEARKAWRELRGRMLRGEKL